MTPPQEGDTYTFERTFTPEDVRKFAEVSGDEQPRHLEPDEEGRLLVHGLLTATMPTNIGGDLEVLARSMAFDFLRPVYTDETVTCTMELEKIEEHDDRYDFTASAVCEKEPDEVAMRGTVEGLIWK